MSSKYNKTVEPVFSENRPMEDANVPAAYRPDPSGQNANDEMIPTSASRRLARVLGDKYEVIPLRPSFDFLLGIVNNRSPSPGELTSNTSIASRNPQYNLGFFLSLAL